MPNPKTTAPSKKAARPQLVLADGVPVHCSHTRIVPLAELQPNPRNPNKHGPKQIKALARIIKQSGWRNPIVVSNRSGLIVKGHGRYASAQRLHLKEVPVDFQDYDSEAAENADLLADNQIAELSTLDKDEAAKILAELDADIDFDAELSGFNFDEINGLLEGLEEGEEDGEEPPNTTVVYEVVIQCANKAEQSTTLKSIQAEGYRARAAKSKLKSGNE